MAMAMTMANAKRQTANGNWQLQSQSQAVSHLHVLLRVENGTNGGQVVIPLDAAARAYAEPGGQGYAKFECTLTNKGIITGNSLIPSLPWPS